MPDVTQESAIERAESMLQQLNDAELALKQKQVIIDIEIKAVINEHAAEVDRLTTTRDRLVTSLVTLYTEHRAFLTEGTGKTVTLRGGSLSSRMAAASLVVDDESAALRYIRRVGKLRIFTKLGKRSLDKVALKKDPAFVSKAAGMHMEQDENLTIKLPKAQSEITRKLHPLRGRLSTTI
jgi:phage host-nuclease inhibitor protein Gam